MLPQDPKKGMQHTAKLTLIFKDWQGLDLCRLAPVL